MPAPTHADQIAKHESNVASARAEHAILSAKIIDDPANKTLNVQLGQLEDEIADEQRKIARLRVGHAEIARRNSVEFKRAGLKALSTSRDRLAESGEELAAVADEIEQLFDALGPHLARWQALVDERAAAAAAIIRQTHSTSDRSANDAIGTIHRHARVLGGNAAVAYTRAMVKAGIGRVGPDPENYVTVVEPMGGPHWNPQMTLRETVEQADSAMMPSIDLHVRRHLREVEGKSDAQPAFESEGSWKDALAGGK